VLCENFGFWGETKIGQHVPMGPGLDSIDVVRLGAFNPVKLLGWFEEVLSNLIEIRVGTSTMGKDLKAGFGKSTMNSTGFATAAHVGSIEEENTINVSGMNDSGVDYSYNPRGLGRKNTVGLSGRHGQHNRRTSLKMSMHQERMGEFELAYGDDPAKSNDYIGESKMMNLPAVRDKNFYSILEKTNVDERKTMGRSFRINRDMMNRSLDGNSQSVTGERSPDRKVIHIDESSFG
jgi:hypothetical protein